MNPLQYASYKGMGGRNGALQFNFQPPHYYLGKQKDFTGSEALNDEGRLNEGWKVREGAIFLEITSAKDKNVYDWDSKIVIALSVNDMGKVLFTLVTGNECKIMHDPGAKSENSGQVKKYLTVTSPKGTAEGVIFNATQVVGEDKKSHMVPLTGDEVLVLRQLIQTAISNSLGW
jgi:Whirly transcription factor